MATAEAAAEPASESTAELPAGPSAGWLWEISTEAMAVLHAGREATVMRLAYHAATELATPCRSNGILFPGFRVRRHRARSLRRCGSCCRKLGVEPGLGPPGAADG